ncbi:MAG TPA: acetyl-CoA C-acetyltransferase [Vicinamibacterales bacterium]|jgi:acetyl-CoA acetyltransferase family protein
MPSLPEVFIVGGARTPMTDFVGALKDVSALELGAIAARGAFEKTGVKPQWIDHVIIGNVLQTSADAIYGARHVGLKAGVPVEVPALTVNRLCGSGIQAAVSGAQLIQLGEASVVLTGGVENMSQAPHVMRGLRTGLRMGDAKLEDSLWEGLRDSYCDCTMAMTAENAAAKYGITRAEQDGYALRSQQLAAKAWADGRFNDEVVPVQTQTRKGVEIVYRDDHVRPTTTLDVLARLPPAFGKDGTVTAGNASGIVDGGAALILASAEAIARNGVLPIGKLLGWAAAGVEPTLMGMGPAPATRAVLGKLSLTLEDLDLIEVNEAFAAQYLAVEKELGLDRNKVNVNGGAIALGHPLGMTGTRLLLTLLLELRRRGKKRGLATACIGGGQGIAAVVEVV